MISKITGFLKAILGVCHFVPRQELSNELLFIFLLGLQLSINDEDANFDDEIDENPLERKKRLQGELEKALSIIGVKHMTFYNMLNKNRNEEVRSMLNEALQVRFDRLTTENDSDSDSEEIDMTTIHESYQFLIKKYVDGDEDPGNGLFVDASDLKSRKKKVLTRKEEEERQRRIR